MTVSGSGAHDAAMAIADELTKMIKSGAADPARMAELVKQARELGDEARKASIERLQSLMAEQGRDLKAELAQKMQRANSGPPTRRMASLKASLRAPHLQSQLGPDEAAKINHRLDKLSVVAIDRYRITAHRMPAAVALNDPTEVGRLIANEVKNNPMVAQSKNADWVGADLSGQQLDGAVLIEAFLDEANFSDAALRGAVLRLSTFSGADFSRADLTGADLSGANLGRANLSGARLDGANLERAVLDMATLEGASFRGANLTEATFLRTEFGNADFTNAKLDGCKWLGLKMNEAPNPDQFKPGEMPDLDDLIDPIRLDRIKAAGVRFQKAVLLGCKGVGAQFPGAEFLYSTFARCDLTQSNFAGVKFDHTNVVLNSSFAHSSFKDAVIKESFFGETDLSFSDMSGATLTKCYFGSANMMGSDFNAVNASAARFERADLTRSTFSSAKLIGARFTGAKLQGAAFDGANLSFADFSQSAIDQRTSFRDVTGLYAQLPAGLI